MSPAKPLIIHVVARLKPEQCGVSDFALAIAGELEAEFAFDSAFVVVNSDLQCDVPYPRVYCGQSELLQACNSLAGGRAAALLVHLSGYGFSRDGAPAELAAGLSKIRRSGQFQVAVYFHELYATGMPWKSAFWHSRRQRTAVRQIAEECDLLVTNTRHHGDWLEQATIRRSRFPIQIIPVLSNVGESQVLTPTDGRRSILAIFGVASTRRKSYDQLGSLGGMINDIGIKEILDIGPAFDAPANIFEIPVKRVGMLPAPELADLLSHARFGFVPHPPFTFAKSGIFAGFCAHGTIPVIAKQFDGEFDGVKDGVHVISPQTAKTTIAAGLEKCSIAVWEWYSQHRLHVHAKTYSQLLFASSIETDTELSSDGEPGRAGRRWAR